jgi:hypothetical protein
MGRMREMERAGAGWLTDRPETSFQAFTRISGDWMGVSESQPISVSMLRRERLSTMITSCPCEGWFSKAWHRGERGRIRMPSHGPLSRVCDMLSALGSHGQR